MEMTSAHPDARYLNGALDITSVSASTAIGVTALMDLGPISALRDALLDAIPSCAADVGMLMNGMCRSAATSFPISILLPPPTASMNLECVSLAISMALSTLATVAVPVR